MSDQNALTDSEQALQKLEQIGTKPLIIIKSVFFLKPFPCTLTLDREKITITNQTFFYSKDVENVFVKDLVSISTTQNMFFASIMIVSGLRLNRTMTYAYFWKKEAEEFRSLCEGLRIAHRENIDVLSIEGPELIPRLYEIGSANTA